MKMLTCKDIGLEDDFVATGSTNMEVKDNMVVHLKKEHGEIYNIMFQEEREDLDMTMELAIKDEIINRKRMERTQNSSSLQS